MWGGAGESHLHLGAPLIARNGRPEASDASIASSMVLQILERADRLESATGSQASREQGKLGGSSSGIGAYIHLSVLGLFWTSAVPELLDRSQDRPPDAAPASSSSSARSAA
jgi:hypothetical protein